MFRKVVQNFTNTAKKLGWVELFQKGLLQQEPASLNAYESDNRNVAGLSYKKDITKVQQSETFPTQYTGMLKFLLGKIPAGGSSGIARPSLGGGAQFKKLRNIARLNPALCYSKGQSVSFGASQQTVKNVLAEGEKSDILSRIRGLMENPISHSFREDEMPVNTNEQHIENSQKEQLQDKNELEGRIKEPNDRATKPTEEKNQLDKDLNSAKQSLNEKDKELESKNKESESKAQGLEALKSESQIKDLQKQLESRNKGLEDNKDRKPPVVNVQGVKGKVNYASAYFILSGVCAVGASLATPYLAIHATLAVAVSVFLASGCYCLYKANTTLSNVKVDQQDNQRLLESSL